MIDAAPTRDRPIRLVQLSDLHMQSVGDRERAVAAEVIRLKPDLVVLSDDVIDRADTLGVLDTFLGLLGAVPKVAVLGNWEYWSGLDPEALRNIKLTSDTTPPSPSPQRPPSLAIPPA